MLKTFRSEIDSLGWIVRTLTVAAVAGAIYKELRLPPEERTWHGRLLSVVPYDFRVPTPAKLIRAWWNPGSDTLVSETPFGVGWSINLAAVAGKVQQLRASGSSTTSRRRKRSS